MQIGLCEVSKIDKVKQSNKDLLQTKEPLNQPSQTKDWKFVHYYPQDWIIGDQTKGVKTKSSFKDLASYAFVSEVKPKTIDEALTNNDWIIAMEEELHQLMQEIKLNSKVQVVNVISLDHVWYLGQVRSRTPLHYL